MAMNTGTKLMLGLGAIGIVIGILVMVLGAGSIGDAAKWRPTDDVYLENSQGETVSFIHIKDGNGDSIAVFVSDEVRCDDFTLEIQGGEASWKADTCIDVEGRSLPFGYEDDPEGWLHLGTIVGVKDGVEYTITTSQDVVLVGWEDVEEVIGDFLGGLAAICGGPTFLCCGLLFLVIGGVMAATSSGNKPQTQIEITPSVEVDSQNNELEDGYEKDEKKWYDEDSS
tara:strand:- start:353 stop:1030 length:678 start_codon:yes stop_codon:yes gene_type:complete